MANLVIISEKEVKLKIKEATEIMKNIDPKDAPIVACALSVQNEGIWSEYKHLFKQKIIKVWHTQDLMKFI